MTNPETRYTSRSNRSRKPNGMSKLLNVLIGVVVVLIVITAGFIFLGGDEKDEAATNNTEETSTDLESSNNETEDETEIGSEEIASEDENTEGTTEDDGATEEEATATEEETVNEDSTTGGTVTSSPSDDALVSDSIVNTEWKPVGTSQTGEHTSVYSTDHVDWDEKVKALAYTTGLSADNMIIWHIGNGGSPQKSIGVVSSNNKEEKYRVYLQWVDGEGWKPEKMETLKTLDGAY